MEELHGASRPPDNEPGVVKALTAGLQGALLLCQAPTLLLPAPCPHTHGHTGDAASPQLWGGVVLQLPCAPRGAVLKPEEALADAPGKRAGEVPAPRVLLHHSPGRRSPPLLLWAPGWCMSWAAPAWAPLAPCPPTPRHSLPHTRSLLFPLRLPQNTWSARPRRQRWGGRAGRTPEHPRCRAGPGGLQERGKVRGVFSAARRAQSPSAPSGGTGHREHTCMSTHAHRRVRAQTSCPKKVTGGEKGEG